MENIEVWKDIPDYEGFYQVSNLGNVRTLDYISVDGKKIKGRIRKQHLRKDGYCSVNVFQKTKRVHQLIAKTFLNHVPCGFDLVVNHINQNRSDNRVVNLEIITNRENTSQKHINHSSKYTGVGKNSTSERWQSRIRINGKLKYLGSFTNEYDAHIAYQNKLKEILNPSI